MNETIVTSTVNNEEFNAVYRNCNYNGYAECEICRKI